jgi:hypothetical protein
MFNTGRTLWRIFVFLFVLSITSSVLAQSPKSNSSLSESDIIKIIDRIHESEKTMIKEVKGLETTMRNYTDTKFEKLDTKLNTINTELNTITTEMAVINANIGSLILFVTIFGAPVLVSIVILALQYGYTKWIKPKVDLNKTTASTNVITSGRQTMHEIKENIAIL